MSVHAQRLERWIGAELVEGLSRSTRGWYGSPIPIMGVPGRVYADGSGGFVGSLHGGFFASAKDYAMEKLRRAAVQNLSRMNIGFSSLSDLIAEATGGKSQEIVYQRASAAKVAAGYCQDMWNKGAVPAAGNDGGAAPGGTVYDNTSAGALAFTNPAGSDTAHIINWNAVSDRQGALLLYDRLFAVSCSHNSASTVISGVPTRYQDASAKNSFVSARVTTVLTATAHNIALKYVDQDGHAAEANTAVAARVSAAVDTIPLTTPQWFFYLNSGDTGVRYITQWDTTAANTGVSDVFIGHVLAICPMPIINVPFILDGINSAFNLVEVKSSACLALMEYFMTATNAANNNGLIKIVSG
jgi:hypothetical protein